MSWKTLILVLACAHACLAEDFVRKAQEALRRAAQRSFESKASRRAWNIGSPASRNIGSPASWDTRSPASSSDIAQIQKYIAQPKVDVDGNLNLQPYHESLRKSEAADREVDDILDHPTSPPPINSVLRHRIVLAYAIHSVAKQLSSSSCVLHYDRDYNNLIDTAIKQGLSSPVEAVKEIQDEKAFVKKHVEPAATLIHSLCDVSSRRSVEMCDLLVLWSIYGNHEKYYVASESIIYLAKVYDSLKDLEPELREAADTFTEVAYLINGKEKLRKPITDLVHVYDNAHYGEHKPCPLNQ